jgi:1-phosphatidylinositol-4-phosphate 5-kinase
MDYSLLIGLHEQIQLTTTHCPASPSPFTRDDGGFQATFADNGAASEIYYLGIIDILTPYSLYKRLEHAFKSLILPRDTISAVNPSVYARRFLKFMNRHILRDVNHDYSTRPLPPINPEEEEED